MFSFEERNHEGWRTQRALPQREAKHRGVVGRDDACRRHAPAANKRFLVVFRSRGATWFSSPPVTLPGRPSLGAFALFCRRDQRARTRPRVVCPRSVARRLFSRPLHPPLVEGPSWHPLSSRPSRKSTCPPGGCAATLFVDAARSTRLRPLRPPAPSRPPRRRCRGASTPGVGGLRVERQGRAVVAPSAVGVGRRGTSTLGAGSLHHVARCGGLRPTQRQALWWWAFASSPQCSPAATPACRSAATPQWSPVRAIASPARRSRRDARATCRRDARSVIRRGACAPLRRRRDAATPARCYVASPARLSAATPERRLDTTPA